MYEYRISVQLYLCTEIACTMCLMLIVLFVCCLDWMSSNISRSRPCGDTTCADDSPSIEQCRRQTFSIPKQSSGIEVFPTSR